jgi:glycosyltransferase involved in cell wall biosynthesis
LRRLLNALASQVYPSDRLEVVVVDNSSTDDTEDAVREAAEWDIFPVRYLRKQDDGPAASRNRGAEMASGELLAFTDSDCIPSPGWIRSAVAEFRPGVGVVCGPITPLPVSQDEAFFSHQIHDVNREDGLYATANVFYRRAEFLRLGGFDETMRSYSWGQPVGGDDTAFGWRVRRSGHQSAFASGSVVFHQATPVTLKGYIFHTVAARVIPKLVASVPELRETCLYKRYFLHKQSATFYPLIAGMALTQVTPWAALLGVPWLQSTWPALKIDVWPPKRWGRAALRLALEFESSALLAMTLVYSSVRNRRLVL